MKRGTHRREKDYCSNRVHDGWLMEFCCRDSTSTDWRRPRNRWGNYRDFVRIAVVVAAAAVDADDRPDHWVWVMCGDGWCSTDCWHRNSTLDGTGWDYSDIAAAMRPRSNSNTCRCMDSTRWPIANRWDCCRCSCVSLLRWNSLLWRLLDRARRNWMSRSCSKDRTKHWWTMEWLQNDLLPAACSSFWKFSLHATYWSDW